MPKSIYEMTDEELREYYNYWKDEIENAKYWGAALAAASKWRDAAEEEIKLRANRKSS